MAIITKKPEWFSPNAINNAGIEPKELDDWVNYLREETYESEKNRLMSVEDISVKMTCWYSKYSDNGNVNGEIAVFLYTPLAGLKRIVSTFFSKRNDTIKTIDHYQVFKGIIQKTFFI